MQAQFYAKSRSFYKSGPENLIDFQMKFIVAQEYPAHIIFRTKIKEVLSRFHCLAGLRYLNHEGIDRLSCQIIAV